MNTETFSPLLLRRRLSVPEIVMRKYSLAQKTNDEESDSYRNSFPRKKVNNRRKTKELPSNKTTPTTELKVISNVRLSQPTLDLICREILKETKLNFPTNKQIISNVDAGSPYGPARVPRYSATPRTSSMEVNASSSGNENNSDSDSFLDSLEDLSKPFSPPLPDNSENARTKSRSKPSFPAFFVPMEEVKVAKPTGNISELLPAKVKQKLFARQEKRQKKQSETVLPKVTKDLRPVDPKNAKRFIVKPKKKAMSSVVKEKSKIPVSMTPNLPKIVDSKKTKIPVKRDMDKVDRLIANILIDTLNKGVDDGEETTSKATIPQGWSSFYMLKKQPQSPESTSDEGIHNTRKINSHPKNCTGKRRQNSPLSEWSVTVEGSYVPDMEMRLRFHRTSDRRRKMVDQKNLKLPAMKLSSHATNESWSEIPGLDTTSKVTSTKSKARRDVLPKDSQLTAILRKFPGLLSVHGNGIIPETNSINRV